MMTPRRRTTRTASSGATLKTGYHAPRRSSQRRTSSRSRAHRSADNVSRGCVVTRSEEHTSELQSRLHLVCRLLLEKKKKQLSIVQYGRAGGTILNLRYGIVVLLTP